MGPALAARFPRCSLADRVHDYKFLERAAQLQAATAAETLGRLHHALTNLAVAQETRRASERREGSSKMGSNIFCVERSLGPRGLTTMTIGCENWREDFSIWFYRLDCARFALFQQKDKCRSVGTTRCIRVALPRGSRAQHRQRAPCRPSPRRAEPYSAFILRYIMYFLWPSSILMRKYSIGTSCICQKPAKHHTCTTPTETVF